MKSLNGFARDFFEAGTSPQGVNINASNAFSLGMPLSAFGDLRTVSLSPQLQYTFEYTVDNTDLFTKTSTLSGTVTHENAMSKCSTGTTAGSKAEVKSARHAFYRAGLGSRFRCTCLFETSAADSHQVVGLFSDAGVSSLYKNGLAFGYKGTTFGVFRWANDVEEFIPQSSWDDPMDGTGVSGMTLDHTKLNVYEIIFQYLGAGMIEFPRG